ncbi:putative holin [Leclercia pneumoniae]|uniref:putative holin n=1 Tax=Leclercia pneumoniae TaxID=2815358 RepID=UPI003AF95065
MYDPLTTTAGLAAGGAGLSFAAMFPEATPSVMLCALTGAALYVLTGENHQFWKQVVFALISFVGGVYSADFISEILSRFDKCLASSVASSSIYNRSARNWCVSWCTYCHCCADENSGKSSLI